MDTVKSPLCRASDVLDSIEGSVYAVVEDLVDGRFWERGGEIKVAAASTIKVAVMIEAFRRRDLGSLDHASLVTVPKEWAAGGAGIVKELHDGVQLSVLDLITLMIILSDNTATNACLDLVGFEAATRAATSLGATSTVIRRKLMGAAFYERPDYSIEIDNTTSAKDMVALLKALYNATAASVTACKDMIDILLRQQVNDRIPLLLPNGTRVAHKTGEFQTTRHDVGIVYPENGAHPYAVAFMTTNLRNVVEASRALAQASRVVYDFMAG